MVVTLRITAAVFILVGLVTLGHSMLTLILSFLCALIAIVAIVGSFIIEEIHERQYQRSQATKVSAPAPHGFAEG